MSELNMRPAETSTLEPLVEPGWLEEHLGDPDLRVVDATVQVKLWPFPRIRSGRRGFKRSHIPGAAFADLLELSDPNAPSWTFTMPSAERFAEHMGRLGIGDGTRVVLYDGRENMWAARLWWMLRAFGFDDAAVLNGGWTAWRLEDRPISSKPCLYPSATFTPRPRPELIVSKEEVLSAIEDRATCILSAVGRRQHRGERNEYGRRGHIPGAKNVTAWQILDRKTMRYRPIEALRELFRPMLEAPRVMTYCGGGVAASSDAFILHVLGHRNVAVYDGGLIFITGTESPAGRSANARSSGDTASGPGWRIRPCCPTVDRRRIAPSSCGWPRACWRRAARSLSTPLTKVVSDESRPTRGFARRSSPPGCNLFGAGAGLWWFRASPVSSGSLCGTLQY